MWHFYYGSGMCKFLEHSRDKAKQQASLVRRKFWLLHLRSADQIHTQTQIQNINIGYWEALNTRKLPDLQ